MHLAIVIFSGEPIASPELSSVFSIVFARVSLYMCANQLIGAGQQTGQLAPGEWVTKAPLTIMYLGSEPIASTVHCFAQGGGRADRWGGRRARSGGGQGDRAGKLAERASGREGGHIKWVSGCAGLWVGGMCG